MLFLKHKKFKDVCIQLFNYNIDNSTITLYGEYWNMGVNKSHRIGEYIAYNTDLIKLENEWEMLDNPESSTLPHLRNANWSKIDFNKLEKVK